MQIHRHAPAFVQTMTRKSHRLMVWMANGTSNGGSLGQKALGSALAGTPPCVTDRWLHHSWSNYGATKFRCMEWCLGFRKRLAFSCTCKRFLKSFVFQRPAISETNDSRHLIRKTIVIGKRHVILHIKSFCLSKIVGDCFFLQHQMRNQKIRPQNFVGIVL